MWDSGNKNICISSLFSSLFQYNPSSAETEETAKIWKRIAGKKQKTWEVWKVTATDSKMYTDGPSSKYWVHSRSTWLLNSVFRGLIANSVGLHKEICVPTGIPAWQVFYSFYYLYMLFWVRYIPQKAIDFPTYFSMNYSLVSHLTGSIQKTL